MFSIFVIIIIIFILGPTTELPVKVTGNVNVGFTAEFTPLQVGAHSISVEYNGHAVNGTPYVAKAYDSSKVLVGHVPKGHVGNTFQFTGIIKKNFNLNILNNCIMVNIQYHYFV